MAKIPVTLNLSESQHRSLQSIARCLGVSIEDIVSSGARSFMTPMVRRRHLEAALADCREMLRLDAEGLRDAFKV